MPRAPGRTQPRKIQPRRRVPLPRRKRGITEVDIERLAEEHALAFNLTPADARAQVIRRLHLTKTK